MGKARWGDSSPAFLPFPTLQPAAGTHCFCFISQEHPPGPVGDVGRYIHTLAQAIATMGHRVHLLTRGQSSDQVDFEQRVWVHRVVPAPQDAESAAALRMPDRIGPHIARLQREVKAISARRKVDAVYAPIWDCEGLALLGPVSASGHLIADHAAFLDGGQSRDQDGLGLDAGYAPLMLGGEQRLLRESSCIHAISGSQLYIVERLTPITRATTSGLSPF
jgi:hypothetical protein